MMQDVPMSTVPGNMELQPPVYMWSFPIRKRLIQRKELTERLTFDAGVHKLIHLTFFSLLSFSGRSTKWSTWV